ncbi:MAG: hypothetical protein R3B09_10365 [Nannocystaceae bacterium]
MRPPPTRRSTRVRPNYRLLDEFSALRERAAFRGVTIGVAGQLIIGEFVPHTEDGTSHWGVQATPLVDILAEFGARRIRFVVGAYSAPVYVGFSDFYTATFLGARAGILAGNEAVRGGATIGGGFFGWEVDGHLFVTPWRDRRGHRHGVALSVGAWFFGSPSVTLGYRFAPAALNHRGGRWEAMRRARGED